MGLGDEFPRQVARYSQLVFRVEVPFCVWVAACIPRHSAYQFTPLDFSARARCMISSQHKAAE